MQKPYDELQTVITPEQAELEERTREGQGVGVSRSAYSRVKCFFCEKGISSNGLAQTNHKLKHVREGMIVELEYRGRRVPSQLLHPPQPRRGHAQDRVLQEGCEINERLKEQRWAESMRTRQAVLDNRAQVALRDASGPFV